MYALLAIVAHATVGIAAAFSITRYGMQPVAVTVALVDLCLASAAISGIGLVSTAMYLSKRLRPKSGVMVGLLCGLLCSATMGLALAGIDFSLILYLTILAPTLLAVLLASLLERGKSGWQS